MGIGRKLLSNTIYLFLDWFILTFFSFLYWFVILGKKLSPESYGIVSTTINFSALLSAITLFGFQTSLTKLIPQFLRTQKRKIDSLILFSIKFLIGTIFIVALFILIFLNNLSTTFKIPSTILLISITTIVAFSFNTLFGAILMGFQNMKGIMTTDFFGKIIELILTLFLIYIGVNYFGPIIATTIAFLLISFLRFIKIPFCKEYKQDLDKKRIILDYSLPAFIVGVAWNVTSGGQFIILSAIKNPGITGIFTIAVLMTSQLAVIPKTMTSALFPIISQLSITRNSKKRQSYLLKLVLRYSLFILLPLSFFLILFSKFLILTFSTAEFISASELFPMLSLSYIIYGCGNLFLVSLYAIGKSKIQRNIVVLTNLFFIFLSIPLTYFFSVFGMVLSYFLSMILMLIISLFFIKKFIGFEFRLIDIFKLLLAGFLSFGFVFILSKILNNIFFLLILFVVALFSYFSVLIPLRFYTKEDIKIIRVASKKIPIFRRQLATFSNFISKIIK